MKQAIVITIVSILVVGSLMIMMPSVKGIKSIGENLADRYPTPEKLIDYFISPAWINEEKMTNRRWYLPCPSGNTYYIRYRFSGIRAELDDILLGSLFNANKIKTYEDYIYAKKVIRHMETGDVARAIRKHLNLLEVNCIGIAYADMEFLKNRQAESIEEMSKRTKTQIFADNRDAKMIIEKINEIVYKNETPEDMYKYLEWLEE